MSLSYFEEILAPYMESLIGMHSISKIISLNKNSSLFDSALDNKIDVSWKHKSVMCFGVRYNYLKYFAISSLHAYQRHDTTFYSWVCFWGMKWGELTGLNRISNDSYSAALRAPNPLISSESIWWYCWLSVMFLSKPSTTKLHDKQRFCGLKKIWIHLVEHVICIMCHDLISFTCLCACLHQCSQLIFRVSY